MSPRKQNRIYKRLIFKHYDQIVISSNEIVNSWKVQRIPMVTLNVIINDSRILMETDGLPEAEAEFLLNLQRNFNKTLTTLKAVCEKQSSVVGDKALSVSELKQFINALKDSFTEAQDKQK